MHVICFCVHITAAEECGGREAYNVATWRFERASRSFSAGLDGKTYSLSFTSASTIFFFFFFFPSPRLALILPFPPFFARGGQ